MMPKMYKKCVNSSYQSTVAVIIILIVRTVCVCMCKELLYIDIIVLSAACSS